MFNPLIQALRGLAYIHPSTTARKFVNYRTLYSYRPNFLVAAGENFDGSEDNSGFCSYKTCLNYLLYFSCELYAGATDLWNSKSHHGILGSVNGVFTLILHCIARLGHLHNAKHQISWVAVIKEDSLKGFDFIIYIVA